MRAMEAIDLDDVADGILQSVKPVNILWQAPDSICFVARGRPGRSEFHADPSDEVMMMVRGDMNLHWLTPDGEERILVLREGEIVYCPAGTPHSPRFAPDSFVMVIERKRRAEEQDRFFWYCANCGAELYEAVRHVTDYHTDPVSRVYEEFYGSEQARTCDKCGHVTPTLQRKAE